jgi:hypothetical protein
MYLVSVYPTNRTLIFKKEAAAPISNLKNCKQIAMKDLYLILNFVNCKTLQFSFIISLQKNTIQMSSQRILQDKKNKFDSK